MAKGVTADARRVPLFADRRFQITGHLDDAPIKPGAFKDNLELSAARGMVGAFAQTPGA